MEPRPPPGAAPGKVMYHSRMPTHTRFSTASSNTRRGIRRLDTEPTTYSCCMQGGEQRNTPLALRIREPTEEERSEVLAERQQEQQQQSTRNGDLLPPVARAIHVTSDSERDSNSTHSTDSTETSIPLPQRTPSAIIKGAVTREDIERLALDALERNDYDLLAVITTHAGTILKRFVTLDIES